MSAAVWKAEPRLWPVAPPERLAMLRIVTGVWTFGYLAIRLPQFLELAHADRRAFAPIGVISWLRSPLRPGAVVALVFVTMALSLVYAAGWWFAASGPAFATTLLVLTTYRSSWGQVLWFETLVALHVAVVGFSPSADALTLVRRRPAPAPSRAYGAPVQLAAVITVVSYVLAGIAKLRFGGIGWMSSTTLQNHIAYSAARLDVLGGTPSPLAPWLVSHPALLALAAVATVVLELGAPLALMGGVVRTVWVASMWVVHVGIAVSLLVVWGYPLWGVAFAPLFRLERLAAMSRRRRQ